MIYILTSNDEAYRNFATNKHIKILNLLTINILPPIFNKQQLENIDYLLLTSKNSVKALHNNEYLSYLLTKPALVIGEATKLAWREVGGEILFCPHESCNGKEFAILLQQSLKDTICNKQILYLCGKERATDFVTLLKDHCHIIESIVYESVENPYVLDGESKVNPNCPNNEIILHNSHDDFKNTLFPDDSIFIFGSPKHYKTFIKYCKWNPTWLALSLGDTTFNSFDENIRKLNAKGNFAKALQVAQAMDNATPLQHENKEFQQIPIN